jgi:3-mercaptopyruvate sulfurtransferase SseA
MFQEYSFSPLPYAHSPPSQGYTNVNQLAGGMKAWRAEGLPEISDGDSSGPQANAAEQPVQTAVSKEQ